MAGSSSSSDIYCGKWYDLNTNIEQREWFSTWDCFYRWFLSVIMFYYCLITTPFSLLGYTFRYNVTWYGFWPGLLLTMYFLFTPFAIFGVEAIIKFKKWISATEDWSTAGPGSIFFIEPESFAGKWLWAAHKNLAMYIAIYAACGNSSEAVSASYVDTDTTKTFWRKLFKDNKVRHPRQLASWNGKSLDKDHKLDCSLVFKVEDGYLGIGDQFLTYGKDFSSDQEIIDMLKKDYRTREVLLLEWVKPDPGFGVHQLDILTMSTADGPKVLHCLVWTHCTGASSHTTKGGYVVDVETGECKSPVGWYSAYFKQQPSEYSDKKVRIPKVKEAIQQALRAHENMPFAWCKMIGWDCMLTDTDEIVFFEGNFAGARLPRRCFLSYEHLWEATKTCLWPFA